MSQFSAHYSTEIAKVLTTALAHFVWQGTALSLMLFLTVKLLGVTSIQRRYLMSMGTLIAMGLAPVLTILWQRLDAVPIHEVELSGQPAIILHDAFAVASANHADVRHSSAILHRPDVQLAVMGVWMAGVLILSTRLVVGFGITLWVRANAKPVSDNIEQLAHRLGECMRVTARNRVFASTRIRQAIAVGFIRPVVLIPSAWLLELTPEMLEAVIAHELAHIRRWDLWVNLMQRVVETLLFYHPAVWWLSRRLRLEREMCCDEIAADCLDRAGYARSLESVATMARGNLLLAASIHGGMKMNLLRRIRHLLGIAPAETGNWWAAGIVAMVFPLLAVAAISITAGSMPHRAVAEEEKPAQTDEVHVKLGDHVGMKISGDLAREFLRLFGKPELFKPELTEYFIGEVTWMFPDGRCRIEYTNGIDRGEKTPELFTATAVVQRSQIKSPRPAYKNAKPPLRGSKRVYPYYLELSDPKGVTMMIWELKKQVGK